MGPKSKSLLSKLALLVVSTIVSLIVLEYAVRALFPFYNPQGPHQIVFHFNKDGVPLGPENQTIRQRSPQGDYDLKVSFNHLGFRDDKDLINSTSADWFAVGDSFGMGWGVEVTNRFSNLLEKVAPFRVFNICVPTDIAGYVQLVQYAERHGATISNLVVSICMENDLRDYYRDHQLPGETVKPTGKEVVRGWIKKHSAVYLLLATELQQSEAMHRFFQAIGIARKETSDELMHKNLYDETAIRYSVNLLSQLATGPRRVIALIIPSRALWAGNNREAESKVHDLFLSEVREKNIEVLDMRPIFEATGNPLQFNFKHDGHWSERGHRAAGERLAKLIVSNDQSVAGALSKSTVSQDKTNP